MKNAYRIREILNEIEELESDIQRGVDAWNDPDGDPCDMADCDPSDQYCKGEEIDVLKQELKELVAEL